MNNGDLSQVILAHQKQLSHKSLLAYIAIDSLAIEGRCDAYQPELAEMAGMSRRHLIRAVAELETIGLVRVKRHYDREQQKTKNTYFLLNYRPDQSDKRVTLPPDQSDKRVTLPPNNTSNKPKKEGNVTEESPMIHGCMMDDDKLKILDFIHGSNRQKCAEVLTVEQARRWREVKDFYDLHELWEPLLKLTKNPVGWIVRSIERGDEPPPLQLPMPEGQIDLSEFRSRGMSVDEIAAAGSSEGELGLNDQGLLVWR